MFYRLGEFVSRYWWLTILFWIALVVLVRTTTPKWDDVTHDGDLAYMPVDMPSVQGEELLQQAFPDGRSKSEAVVILACEDRPIKDEIEIVRSYVSRFQNLLGQSLYAESKQLLAEAEQLKADGNSAAAKQREAKAADKREHALNAFDEAVTRLEDSYERDSYFAYPAHNLAILYEEDGSPGGAQQLRALAWDLKPELEKQPRSLADSNVARSGLEEYDGVLPLLDVWSRYTDTFGSSLTSKDHKADLIFLRLSNEFMAAENISLLHLIENILEDTKASMTDWPADLSLGLSGSAAVGTDMLTSAKESMANTELYTVVLVITILLLVYRSPVLVAVPLTTIVVSLLVATGLVASVTTLNQYEGLEWWNFKIFTTTKIFVVVILFGAGTDYCLFLIARYKEELAEGQSKHKALANSLGNVGEALAASAFTTIVGLGTMFFAEFGKFRNSGPAIGLCLFVTLVACVTLAPAMLRALGSSVYWRIPLPFAKKQSDPRETNGHGSAFWRWMARLIVTRPATVLLSCTVAMLPFFFLGFHVDITYDLLSELEPSRVSKRSAELLRRHFEVGESGPLVVLAQKPKGNFDSAEGKEAIRDLTSALYVDGVTSVRSLISPIGTKPKDGVWQVVLPNHRITRELYLSQLPELDGDVTRLELVLAHDPFSIEATDVLRNVDEKIGEIRQTEGSYWSDSRFVFSGTTAAIRDLRAVTSRDNIRIQLLVVFSVFVILLILLKRPAVCIYLILSVLFSYYVTIGATQLWFEWLYADTFEGLDWKVPIFLFVILVAIGQDYNIYLATRIFEEQKEHGMFGGLRHAIVRTGGIITSCGVIMAGTFFSMTSGSLRGIAELGFALTLGVLLDTFVVRPVLVPAFLAILFRWHVARNKPPKPEPAAAPV